MELGVGGGKNLSHLAGDFLATVVDLSEPMLAQCQRLNPGVPLYVGDMRTVRLGKKFKAVLIHDAINYMLTEEDLRQTCPTAVAHLEPGGIFIIAPDHYRETFHGPTVGHSIHSDGETGLTYIEYQTDLN
jgi:trans-aconitate methyltransferase